MSQPPARSPLVANALSRMNALIAANSLTATATAPAPAKTEMANIALSISPHRSLSVDELFRLPPDLVGLLLRNRVWIKCPKDILRGTAARHRSDLIRDVHEWLAENCNGLYCLHGDAELLWEQQCWLAFEDQKDKVHFALRWGGIALS